MGPGMNLESSPRDELLEVHQLDSFYELVLLVIFAISASLFDDRQCE